MAVGTPGMPAPSGPPRPLGTSSPLDATPPSPQLLGGGPQGQATPLSLQGLVPPDPLASGQMPPEVLSGILASSERVGQMIDAWAQIAPDLGMEFSMIKSQLAATLAKLVERGAQPPAPTSTGAAPPMGGTDRGIAGPGAF